MDSIGDIKLAQRTMPGFGQVWHAYRWQPCTGKYANPGDMFWHNLNPEPFGSLAKLIAALPGLLEKDPIA